MAKKSEVVTIKPIEVKTFEVTIRGTSPLIVNKFSDRAKKQIEEKQQKKAKQPRAVRDPKAEFRAACYMMPGSPAALEKNAQYAFPAAGVKKACIQATRFVSGLTMEQAKGAFFIFNCDRRGSAIAIESPTSSRRQFHPTMREDTVRLASPGRPLDLRYRAEFTDWKMTFVVKFNSAYTNADQILNLLNLAGFAVGIGNWRPGCSGMFGMFEVVSS